METGEIMKIKTTGNSNMVTVGNLASHDDDYGASCQHNCVTGYKKM